MPLVPGSYVPPSLNPLLWQAGGPPIDTDPSSPTYGQPTYTTKLNPAARAPNYTTGAKGNAGQPAPSVPVPQGTDGDAFVYKEPPGKPNAPPAKAEAPQPSPEDVIRGLQPQTEQKPVAVPTAAPPQASAPDPATQTILDLTPKVGDDGKSTDGQPSLYSGTSPSAQATGTPIAEDRVPGAAFQLAINASTDPAQRARIAADQLKIPLDNIIVGPAGRMAAVDKEGGNPYYIEPQQVFASDKSITRQDDGSWGPTPSFHVNPYAAGSPLAPETSGSFAPGNLVRGGAAALPNAAQQAAIWGPTALAEAYGGPTAASATAGLMTSATGAGRQYIANLMDPRRFDLAPGIIKGEDTRAAVANALLTRAAPVANKLLDPAFDILANRPVAPSTRLGVGTNPFWDTSVPITQRQPYGSPDMQSYAPWQVAPPTPPPGMPGGARLQPPPITGESSPGTLASTSAEGGRTLAPSEAAPWSPGVATTPATPPAITTTESGTPYAQPAPRLVPGGALPAGGGVALPEEPPPLTSPIKTQADADARADELIRHYYAGANTTPLPASGVPDHDVSLAQITGNQGGANLERTLRNETPLQNEFGVFDDKQEGATKAAVTNLRGTMEDFTAADAAVNRATADKKASTFSNTTPTSVQPTIDKINELLNSPEAQGSPDVAAGLRETRDLFYKRDPQTGKPLQDQAGNPILQDDPETLYNTRRTINNKISGLYKSQSNDQSKIPFAAGQLGPVKTQLDADIAAGAPEYPSYIQQVSEQKKPIEGQEYLLGRTLTDSKGNPTLAQVNATIRDVENQRNLKSGWQSADALTPDQLQQLYALRTALQHETNLGKGRPLGSNTQQNILATNYNNALMGPTARAAGQVVGGLVGGTIGGLLDPLTGGMAGATFGAPAGIGAARWVENKLIPSTAAGDAMLRKALLDRVLNKGGAGVRALRGER